MKEIFKLVIIGRKGLFYYKYKFRVEEFNVFKNVIFIDFVLFEDMFLFYNVIEVLVYLFFYEGFGFFFVEVMVCGIFVIVFNIIFLFEVCYELVFLIDFYDIDLLVYDIERVLSNSLLKLIMVKKSLICSNEFFWNKIVINIINVYKLIISL